MKLLTWNIRQGGSAKRLPNITKALLQNSPDIMVVTEFWKGEKGHTLQSNLKDAGYIYQVTSQTESKENGILIVSKTPLEKKEPFTFKVPVERWLEVNVPEFNFDILGVHIPTNNSSLHDKKSYWNELKQYGSENLNSRCVIIGDYNTGLEEDAEGAPLHCRNDMKELLDLGWVDCWRYTHGAFKQYSWFSNVGNGFRIDHAFVSPSLKENILEAYFSHKERIETVSDHSILVTELSL
ncbi:endonuclease/exonuclease/phosphatase family protein [Mesobacillus harenae]|uniref:endonuclease/exonuclease/phosphatase family protein n=1 Tax=Mesobacillus harenae TaxID=2213203 RepID=UPI0015805A1E|nr:endonuclease/exonuclease/phosphatase family protein [Mesobacillus harenae]